MEKRSYGKDGEMLSIIGFGGMVVADEEQSVANDLVSEAIEKGINYFDVAPSYSDAEERLGPALIGKRNGIFLACKTTGRTVTAAEKEMKQSFSRLRTDHFDLYQMHGLASVVEARTALGPGGCLELFVKAKEKGLIRYLGFSAHSEEAAELLMDSYDFDSVLFPLNWVNTFTSGFGKRIVKKAQEKHVSMLALKALAKNKIPEGAAKKCPKCWYEPIDPSDKETASQALRYTLSFPITAAIPPGDLRLFRLAIEIAENYTPITEQEIEQLKRKSSGLTPIF